MPKFFSDLEEPDSEVYTDRDSPKESSNKGFFGDLQDNSIVRKPTRLIGQGLIGLTEAATMPYNLGVMGLQTVARNPPLKRAQEIGLSDPELSRSINESQSPWMQQLEDKFRSALEDQERYEDQESFIPEGIKNQNWDVGSLLEKGFEMAGIDMRPEDVSEMAVRWASMIKDPKKIAEISKKGMSLTKNPKELLKFTQSLLPSAKESLRGIGGATALQIAEENELGPIGTLSAAVIGDVLGGVSGGIGKGALKFARHPGKTTKEIFAKGATLASRLNGKEKLALQKDLINSFRQAGIQADLGTITDSNLIKSMQARLSQSGLVGSALEDLKKSITKDIVEKYTSLADQIGEVKFANLHEAGEALQNTVKGIRESDLGEIRGIYEEVRQSAKDPNATVYPDRLLKSINEVESSLTPGSLKSTEQKAVIGYLQKLKEDILDEGGRLKLSKVQDLMNNKIALNDIINYEIQGGAKQLLKPLTGELDRTILQHGRNDPAFAKKYVEANKRFSKHAKTFRNKKMDQIIKGQDPSSFMNKMNTIQGMQDVENALKYTAEGRKLFENLKRFKFDEIVFKNMIDGATNQLKFGKFSNILEKGNNRAVISKLMGPNNYKRLVRLQKASGKIAESAEKFFNASKSGSVAVDAAIVVKAMHDVGYLLAGNPWPLMKTSGGLLGARYLSKLLADPNFLQMVEESILSSTTNNPVKMTDLIQRMERSVKAAILETSKEDPSQQQAV